MKGSLSHELEAGVPAGEVWEIYSTVRFAQLIAELLPSILAKVEAVEGDGGLGTVIRLTFAPGVPGPQSYKEEFVKIDDENKVKETKVVEGGYLDLGFTSYVTRFEILGKGSDSSIIRSTIEYEIDEANAENVSFASTAAVAVSAEAIAKYLQEKKAHVIV